MRENGTINMHTIARAISSRLTSSMVEWLIPLIIVLVVGLVGGGVLYWRLVGIPRAQYTLASADIGTISSTISTSGSVNASALYRMNFTTEGQVREINVRVGQRVRSGQRLARLTIDKTALQNAIDEDQAAVSAATASLTAAQVSQSSATLNLSNVQAENEAALKMAYDQEQSDLGACQGNASCQQLAMDKYASAQAQANARSAAAQNAVNTAQAQATNMQGSLDQAKARLRADQQNLTNANTNATLVAPVNATIAAINGVVGQHVATNASSASSQPFLILLDTTKLSIAARVKEADVGMMQVGLPAQFTVASYPGRQFSAIVSAVEMLGQNSSNTVNYIVDLNVDTSSLNGLSLYPGMTTTVHITTSQHDGALLIPADALRFPTIAERIGAVDRSTIDALLKKKPAVQGDDQGKSMVVMELQDGALIPVPIVVGFEDGKFVEVLSGLRTHDQVIVGQSLAKS